MDAVELPLPANVVVPKLLAAEPDGIGRAREPEGGRSAGPDSSFFGGLRASAGGSYHKDVKSPVKIAEYNSVSKSKKADAEFNVHDNQLTSFKSDENGKRHYYGNLLPKHESKQLIRKSIKNLTSISCSKRPRIDKLEGSMRTMGADDPNSISRKIGSDVMICTSSEKSQTIRPKRGQDGKKTDKRILRAGGKTKYDSLASKPGLANSDSISGGSNILGIYGLKSDLHDVTKHMNELSLDELLDGSYKYSTLCPDKGKKAPHFSENILLSIKKACAILPCHSAKDSSSCRKACTCLPHTDSCSQKMSIGESESSNKVWDSYKAEMSNSTLYQPKEILERLTLPPVQDLDALLFELNMPSVPLQSTGHTRTICSASLPSFRWSFSYNESYKASADLGKLASTRNTCQGRWVRIGSNSMPTGNDKNWFSEFDLRTCCENGDPSDQQKVDDFLQGAKSLNSFVRPSYDGLASMPHIITCHSEAHVSDENALVKGAGFLGPYSPLKLNFPGKHGEIPDSQQNFDSRDYTSQGSVRDEGALKHPKDESKLVNLHEGNDISQKGQPIGSIHGSSMSCYHTPGNSEASGCYRWQSSTPEMLKADHSPRVMAAAKILCEMAGRSGATRTRDSNIGQVKWPKAPSQKTVKACQPVSPVSKADGLCQASRHQDPVRGIGLPMVKHKSTSEQNSSHVNRVGRGPVRWSVREEGASPSKSERDLAVSLKSLDSIPVRSITSMPSPARAEKGFDNQHRVKKTSTGTPVSFGGVHIKDWSRGRIRRL